MQSDSQYTVKHINGCRLIFGSVSLSEMPALLLSGQDGEVMDLHLASLTGATMVTGMKEDLDELRVLDSLPICETRVRERSKAMTAGLPDAFVEWLYRGDRGASSNFIAHKMTGIPALAKFAVPLDSGDFRRCCSVIQSLKGYAPESDILASMSDASEQWCSLADNWPTLKDMEGKSSAQLSCFIGRISREGNRDV